MTHSWYLPCDFHFFIIGVFTCIFISKRKKFGLAILLGLTILSLVIPFVLTVLYTRPGLLLFYPEFLVAPKVHPDFRLTYTKSHTRATPYFVGMFAGYWYYKAKNSEKHFNRVGNFSQQQHFFRKNICPTRTHLLVPSALLTLSLNNYNKNYSARKVPTSY